MPRGGGEKGFNQRLAHIIGVPPSFFLACRYVVIFGNMVRSSFLKRDEREERKCPNKRVSIPFPIACPVRPYL